MEHNPIPELLFLAFLSILVVVFLPDHAAALVSQIIKLVGDNTWPLVILLIALAAIKAFGPK